MEILKNLFTILLFAIFISNAWLGVSLLRLSDLTVMQGFSLSVSVFGMLLSGVLILYVVRIKIDNK